MACANQSENIKHSGFLVEILEAEAMRGLIHSQKQGSLLERCYFPAPIRIASIHAGFQ